MTTAGGDFWQRALDVAHSMAQFLCHQDPARSFQLDGKSAPFCARCAGFYAAITVHAVAMLLAVAWWRPREDVPQEAPMPVLGAAFWLCLGVGLGLAEHGGWLPLSNEARAVAGSCLGVCFVAAWGPVRYRRFWRSFPRALHLSGSLSLGLLAATVFAAQDRAIVVGLSMAGFIVFILTILISSVDSILRAHQARREG
jgi:hypothetical protein